eukprot:9260437-Pyramimonas_sp.AAC.1
MLDRDLFHQALFKTLGICTRRRASFAYLVFAFHEERAQLESLLAKLTAKMYSAVAFRLPYAC